MIIKMDYNKTFKFNFNLYLKTCLSKINNF